MKILVMSDSHRAVEPMVDIMRKEKPDAVFHLGDHEGDALALERLVPGTFVHSVCGNCDLNPVNSARIITDMAGKRIFAAHGHLYNVKFGLEGLVNAAMTAGADIILFGHTHHAEHSFSDGVLIANPGAVGTYPYRYGIITVEGGTVSYEALSLN